MLLSKAVQGFLLARSADGLSENTLIDYGRTLRLLTEHLDDPQAAEVSTDDLRRLLEWLRTGYEPQRMNGDASPLSQKSLVNAWIGLSAFSKWAAAELGIDDAMEPIKTPEARPPVLEPFSQAQVKAILKACKYTATASTDRRTPFAMRRPTARRDRAIVLLLLDTGVRASECGRLRAGDVNLGTGEARIRSVGSGRKSKPRHVYLGKTARRAVWRYLAEREDGEKPEAPLFVTIQNRAMTRYTLRSLCNGLGERAGIAKCYPHRFRHTFAVTYLRNGGDIFTLQRLLGHSSLDMVKRYLALVNADDAAAHRRASPADNWRL